MIRTRLIADDLNAPEIKVVPELVKRRFSEELADNCVRVCGVVTKLIGCVTIAEYYDVYAIIRRSVNFDVDGWFTECQNWYEQQENGYL
jgi:hypothetical protein